MQAHQLLSFRLEEGPLRQLHFRFSAVTNGESLHVQCLLKGISTRSDITPANWTMYLSERLKQMWRTSGETWPTPFAPRRGHEAMEYAKLPTADRCLPGYIKQGGQ